MAVFDLLDDKTINRIKKHAAEAQAAPPAYLKYEPGIWKIGGEDFTNSEWLAITDMTGIGWKLFIDNNVVEEHMVLALGNDKPRRPDSHTDKDKWKLGNDGRRKDPWSFQYSLPLLNEKSGKVVVFNASSVTQKTAISALLEDFARKRRRQIVSLTSETVRIDDKDLLHPVFEIIGHSEDDTPLKGVTIEKHDAAAAVSKPNDMDDDIPF
jgi:hypothetical protein